MIKPTRCDCCGQPDGVCPNCGSLHVPAVAGACEKCIQTHNQFYDGVPELTEKPASEISSTELAAAIAVAVVEALAAAPPSAALAGPAWPVEVPAPRMSPAPPNASQGDGADILSAVAQDAVDAAAGA